MIKLGSKTVARFDKRCCCKKRKTQTPHLDDDDNDNDDDWGFRACRDQQDKGTANGPKPIIYMRLDFCRVTLTALRLALGACRRRLLCCVGQLRQRDTSDS